MFSGGMIVCFFVSGILFFFNYQIGKKKDLTFIAGFNEETFKGDKNKLAEAVHYIINHHHDIHIKKTQQKN